MKPLARAALWAALSSFLAILLFGVVAIYGFDGYERAWGRGGSLQVVSWAAAVVSPLLGVAAMLGFWVSRVSGLSKPRAAGTVVGLSIVGLALLAQLVIPDDSELSGLPRTFALLLLTFVLAIVVARVSSGRDRHAT